MASEEGAGSVVPTVDCLFDDSSSTCTYVVSCPDTLKTMIIDSVLGYNPVSGRTDNTHNERVVKYVEEKKLDVEWVLETHVHADHVTGADYLKKHFDAKTGIGAHVSEVQELFKEIFNLGDTFKTDGSQFLHLFKDGDEFKLGNVPVRCLHVPGHTPACMAYIVGDAVFTGDTLFMPDFGTARCDFPGGSVDAMYDSVTKKLYDLPDTHRVFVGHDYKPGGRELKWETTIGEEKANNKQLKADTTREEFTKFRSARDAMLNLPRLIVPSLQINLRNGSFPPPEENGTSYIKVPINTLGSDEKK